jgi:TolB-like protein
MLTVGCASSDWYTVEVTPEPAESKTVIEKMLMQANQYEEEQELMVNQIYSPHSHHLKIESYVEQMALDLVDTMVSDQAVNIAVVSFVNLDKTLQKSSQLGNQLSEIFIHQLQKFGYGVVDFKTTDHVAVTYFGDFVFSRDTKQLSKDRIASHVLSGTLVYRANGIEINARVIDIDSKRVVASSTKLVPSYVLERVAVDS